MNDRRETREEARLIENIEPCKDSMQAVADFVGGIAAAKDIEIHLPGSCEAAEQIFDSANNAEDRRAMAYLTPEEVEERYLERFSNPPHKTRDILVASALGGFAVIVLIWTGLTTMGDAVRNRKSSRQAI